MSWRTPMAKAVAEMLSHRHGVLTHLLRNQEVAQQVLSDPPLLIELFGTGGPWDALLDDATIREHLQLDRQAAAWVDPAQVLEHLSRDKFCVLLEQAEELGLVSASDLVNLKGADVFLSAIPLGQRLNCITAEAMLRHLGDEAMLAHLGSEAMLSHLDDEVIRAHLGSEKMLAYLGAEVMLAHVGGEAMLAHLGHEKMLAYLGNEVMLAHLGSDAMIAHLDTNSMLAHLGNEVMLAHVGAEVMLAHLGAAPMLDFLGSDAMLEHLGAEAMLAHLGSELMFEQLGAKAMLAHLGAETMLAHLGSKVMLEHLGEGAMLAHLGRDVLLNALSLSDVVSSINIDDLLKEANPDEGAISTFLSEHPEVLESVLKENEAKKDLLVSLEPSERQVNLEGVERLKGLDYSLPAALVAYPRTGSNFIQSILSYSSGTENISIYIQNPHSFEPLLTVKSHALSPEYLLDEYARFMQLDQLPEKIILLKRDPRDVMISFYEYTQAQRNVDISQEEFLEEICFFYASTIDKNYTRHVDIAPLSVVGAYRKHVQQWFVDRPSSLPVLEISYEDMVQDPTSTFRTALDFLGLDVPVAEPYFELKVSLYSEEDRERGEAQGWKNSAEDYAILLEGVERLMAPEIEILGYVSAKRTKKSKNTTKKKKN